MALRRILRAIAAAALVAVAGLAGFVAHLGYFGGQVFATVAATAPRVPGTAAVFLSGDSGMETGMAPRIVAGLAARGMPVLAVNTLTAYAHGRTPAQTRDLIATALHRALALPGTTRVVLIGQSFGADMLQVGLAGLPPGLRARVAQVILVVPGDSVTFRATPGGFLNGAPSHPALPTARRLDWVPVTCIHGMTEADSLCPLLGGANVRTEALPGNHYLHHDAARLVDTLWQATAHGGRLPKVQAAPSGRQSAAR